MATQTLAPDAREIYAAVTLRLEELRPLVEEYRRLEEADAALTKALGQPPKRGPGRPPSK